VRRVLFFDAFASPEEVAQESVASLRSTPGVRSVEVFSAVDGAPRYCAMLDTDDAHDAEVQQRITALLNEYAGYISNVSHRVLRRIG